MPKEIKSGEKYLVWGYYGFGNLGDELMLEIISARISRSDSGSRVYVRCCGKPMVKGVIPFDIERKRPKLSFLRHFHYFFRLIGIAGMTDSLVIGGGTLFLGKGRHNLSMLALAFVVFIYRLARKKIYTIGVGVDKLDHFLNRLYLRYIVKASDEFIVRDDFSFSFIRSLTKSGSVRRAADILYLNDFSSGFCLKQAPREYVVVALSDYYLTWGGGMERATWLEESVRLVRSLLGYNSGKYKVLLCAFQKGAGEMDFEFLSSVRGRILDETSELSDRLLLRYARNAREAKEIFNSAVFTIGMRYHALVLSSICHRPFLGINIEMKIKEVCRYFSMPCLGKEEFLSRGIGQQDLILLEKSVVPADVLEREIERAEINFGWLEGAK